MMGSQRQHAALLAWTEKQTIDIYNFGFLTPFFLQHTLRYSVNLLMKPMKCSALRMFPGMASTRTGL